MRALLVVTFASMLFACTSTGGEGTSPAELEDDWGAACDNFAATCPDMAQDPAGCKAQYPCLAATFRPDMLAKTVACESARVCESGSDDACYSLEAQGLTPSSTGATFKTDCLARKSECDAMNAGSFGDDYCFIAETFKDSVIDAVAACLAQPCDATSSCFKTSLSAAAPACTEGQ
jgi:hypothetical protein